MAPKFIGGLILVFLFSSVLAGEFDITPENIEAFQPIADHLKIPVEEILLAHQKFYGNLTKRADQFNPSPTPTTCTVETASCEDGNACTALGTCSKDDTTQQLYCYGYNNPGAGPNSPTNARGKVCGYTDGDLCQPIKCKADETCSDHTVISCSDSDLCTTNERCVSGVCLKDTVSCNDNSECTTDTCNSATGCVFTPITCDDSSVCTTDTCNPATGCVYTPITCDDSSECTTDTCNPATGCVYTPITCDDSSECTTDTCNPATGCVYTPVTCDDSSECTTDTCNPATGCVYTPITCDDSSVCTTDTCNPATGCVYTPVTCDDFSACTTDTCNAVTGCVYTSIDCSDGNSCTTDSCDATSGCSNVPKTSFYCDNGTPVPLDNRCEVTPSETIGENLCKGHPCVKDDNPNLPAGHNKGFCDCYSGWSGQQCDVIEIQTGDVLPPVDAVNGNFKPAVPTLDPQDEFQGRPALALTITIPSSQSPLHNPNTLGSYEKLTRLVFQNPTVSTEAKRSGDLFIPATNKRDVNDNPNACNYPNNPRWVLDTVNNAQQGWIDSYSNSFDYAELAVCGLSFVNQDGNFAYFNTSLRIERDYTLGNQRFTFDRTFFVDQIITIEFPRHLSVSTNVVVSNNTVEFYAAVTEVHFNPIDQVWDITISTAINKPFYKLELAAAANNPHPSSPIRDWDFISSDIESCPNDYSGDCKQTWKYQTHSCDALNIEALTMDFNVICVTGTTPNSLPGECATPNPEQVEAVIQIKTASACPRSGEYKITGSSMNSYDDNSYTDTKGLFGISENMYLGVDFDAPPAGISSIEIVSLCAYPRINNPSDVPPSCPQERKVDLNDVHSEAATNYGTHKFAFYTQAGHLKAAAGVAENQNKITVQAELKITYDGELSKRTAANSRHYTLSTDLLIKGDAVDFEQEIAVQKSFATMTSVGIFVTALAIAILF